MGTRLGCNRNEKCIANCAVSQLDTPTKQTLYRVLSFASCCIRQLDHTPRVVTVSGNSTTRAPRAINHLRRSQRSVPTRLVLQFSHQLLWAKRFPWTGTVGYREKTSFIARSVGGKAKYLPCMQDYVACNAGFVFRAREPITHKVLGFRQSYAMASLRKTTVVYPALNLKTWI